MLSTLKVMSAPSKLIASFYVKYFDPPYVHPGRGAEVGDGRRRGGSGTGRDMPDRMGRNWMGLDGRDRMGRTGQDESGRTAWDGTG